MVSYAALMPARIRASSRSGQENAGQHKTIGFCSLLRVTTSRTPSHETPSLKRRTEHNTKLPHSAFRGQTPDEQYFGMGTGVPDVLAAKRKAARRIRLEENRAVSCQACDPARHAS